MTGELTIGLGAFFFFFGTIAATLSLAATVFWIWMIADCIMHEPAVGNDKLVWIILMICLPVIGSLLYFFLKRPQRPVTAEMHWK
jgi:hypothetical protein